MAADDALTYDYDSDTKWKAYFANLEFVAPPSAEQIKRIKHKWYAKNVAQTPSPGAASSTSAPRPPPSKAYHGTAPTEAGGTKDKGAVLDWSKLRSLATGNRLQTVWFVAHVLFLVHAAWFFVPVVGWDYHVYRRAAWLALATYAMPLYTAHGMVRLNQEYAQRALMDSNSHYVYYALVMVAVGYVSAITGAATLAPLAVYSAYSTQGFVRGRLGLGLGRVDAWLDAHKAAAGDYAVKAEVAVLPLAAVTGAASLLGACAGSLIHPLLYYNFLKMRYVVSGDTRRVVTAVTSAVLAHPSCPAALHSLYAYMASAPGP